MNPLGNDDINCARHSSRHFCLRPTKTRSQGARKRLRIYNARDRFPRRKCHRVVNRSCQFRASCAKMVRSYLSEASHGEREA